jgi:hypothetical protein
MHSIDWKELCHAVREDIMGVVTQEILKDDIRAIIESKVMKYSKIENVYHLKTSSHWGCD